MTIRLQLSPETEKKLHFRANAQGIDVESYLQRFIENEFAKVEIPESGKSDLDRSLAPLRQEFAASGMTEDELDALVEEARNDIWQEKHRK